MGVCKRVERCRLCHSPTLTGLLDLGEQYLTGIFPQTPNAQITRGPLALLRCTHCGLVQLAHSYDLHELYGPNYGYRSGLNRAMVEHLQAKAKYLQQRVELKAGDIVVDIGSSDGTLLSFYPRAQRLVGFDPGAEKLKKYYRQDVRVITDFFSADRFAREFGAGAKAKIVSSIAMFYDLEDPLDFVRQVDRILADDGIWHLEQSYMPSMLASNAYDTICHEHLEYYALQQIKWITDQVGLKIVDVQINDVNGGSFAVTVGKRNAVEQTALVNGVLDEERRLGLHTDAPFVAFKDRVYRHRDELLQTLGRLRREGKVTFGYGASTKGNVILQFCGIDSSLIPCIAEVNETKFGCFTPGTNIPIVSEAEARRRKPDVFMVLPWHFRRNLVARERDYLQAGGKMLFPLPSIEVVEA
ncbi:MAG: class I SAM-dependent methyltransferase [Planctomycetota bacterium]|nr:class I SAM-dependent methyltransferase [Planctomycetota bacterium]